VRPLPEGLDPQARVSALPGADGAGAAPSAVFRLPTRVRRLLLGLQAVRDAGGHVGAVVHAAASSVPGGARFLPAAPADLDDEEIDAAEGGGTGTCCSGRRASTQVRWWLFWCLCGCTRPPAPLQPLM
jgi:hypothetical protein